MSHKTLKYSVILIGDSGAGKTCMMHRYAHNKFDTTHKFTIGLITFVVMFLCTFLVVLVIKS